MGKSDLLQKIIIKKGDITLENSDAIVNAANTSLLGGGGVDGAIYKAAGQKLIKECRAIGGCNAGEARITKGYNLKARYIIHTPGPIYKDGKRCEDQVLKNSYIIKL
jgi:O-acetyl-ADP-ribose deacetylase (regulator of RNase III)